MVAPGVELFREARCGLPPLTSQQSADLPNLSRPYLVKLLEEGRIPYRTVGKYHCVRFDDLMAYKRTDDEARAKILDQPTADACLAYLMGKSPLQYPPDTPAKDPCGHKP